MRNINKLVANKFIGIVSTDSQKTVVEISRLYTLLVEYGTNRGGCQKDQDHPSVWVFGIPAKKTSDVRNNFALAGSFLNPKSSILVTLDKTKDSERINREVNKDLEIISIKDGESLSAFSKRIFDISFKRNTISSNEDFVYFDNKTNPELEEYAQKIRGSTASFIGGAGPLAGARFGEILARKISGQNNNITGYIGGHFAGAPDKNNAILGTGPDFFPYYKETIEKLSPFAQTLSIPCNTAHAKATELSKFSEEKKMTFLDIRDATISSLKQKYPNPERVILLSTPATIKSRLYHDKLENEGYKIIIPNEEEISSLYFSIYKIKGDEKAKNWNNDPKKTISNVVSSIREREGNSKIPVIFGCTEFNIPFDHTTELDTNNIVDTTQSLAIVSSSAVKNIPKTKITNSNAISLSSNNLHNSNNSR